MRRWITRIAILAYLGIALFVLLSARLTVDPAQLDRYLGNVVGLHAAVSPNQYNTLAQQLLARSQELDEREAALARREQELRGAALQSVVEEQRKMIALAVMSFALFGLIVFNYVLDHLRFRQRKEMSFAGL